MKKYALVTGGAGFIGSHLCEKLIDLNYGVICVDNLFRGSKCNLENIFEERDFHFYDLDLNKNKNIFELQSIIECFRPIYIFHYAAINGTKYFYDIPYEVALTNSLSTLNLLNSIEFAMKIREYTPKIIFASSSEVYGSADIIPTDENAVTYLRTDEDRDSYAAGKLMSEFYIKLFAKKFELDYFIFRIFNVFGPRMIHTQYGQVIPELINKAICSKGFLELIGSGEETRSFCYIDDHVDLTLNAIDKAKSCETYNLGNPEEISIKTVANIIQLVLGKELEIKTSLPRSGDHSRRCPNIKKLISFIDGYKFIPLKDGIKKMILKSKKIDK